MENSSSFLSSRSLPPLHTFAHSPPNPSPSGHHQHHWHPTENHDAAHLECQPSHFSCRGKHLPRWLLRARPYSRDLGRVFVRFLAQAKFLSWQCRWHQELLGKTKEGGRRRQIRTDCPPGPPISGFCLTTALFGHPRSFSVNRKAVVKAE